MQNRAPLTQTIYLAIVCTLALNSSFSMADQYGVQVGAYQSLQDTTLEKASNLGEVLQVNKGGLTSIIVGAYDSYESAQASLGKFQSAGFTDAFVRKLPHQNAAHHSTGASRDHETHNHGGSEHVHLPSGIEQRINQMTEQERQNIVILDGKLHRKVGDQFIPID